MPYITNEERAQLDELIDALAAAVVGGTEAPAVAGRLNYAITRLALSVLPVERYWHAALVTGVLENVQQELYRRSIALYEDRKMAEHGDVPEFGS
jgi:hypothetical protein